MTTLFRISGLDLADTDTLPDFILFCQNYGVEFRVDQARGPNGYPTCNLLSDYRPALGHVLEEYCGGDRRAACDLDGTVEVIEVV